MVKSNIKNYFNQMKNSKFFYISFFLILALINGCSHENIIIEEKQDIELNNLDMITPAYYKSNTEISFIENINKFLSIVHQEQFHHPLKDELGLTPDFSIPNIGKFGAGKGPTWTEQHHPAVDLHVENNKTKVNLYASYDGFATTVKDADKYRQYVSVEKEVVDDKGNLIGKIVTLFAHVDLDLDEAESLNLNGKEVKKGEIISRNLYSGTVGGPHLHFEIRYYRPGESGNETFYGFLNPGSPNLTQASAGGWSFGVWNPNIGYGFGNPESFELDFY